MKYITYTVIFTPEPEGGFTATVPALQGCVTYGRDLSEAKKMAKEAIVVYVESLKKHHEIIPSDTSSFISSVTLQQQRLSYV